MTKRICFITSLDVNVGDEFIREGICSFFDEIYGDWLPYYVNKVGLDTIYTKIKDEKEVIGDKLVNADIVVQAGAPVYWKIGESTCYNVEWADELWFKRIFKLGPSKPILNIAAGSCQPYPDIPATFLNDPKCVDFARKAASSCVWTSVRDPLASQILYALDIEHAVLPCSAFHAARRVNPAPVVNNLVGINLMPYGGHFRLKDDLNNDVWMESIYSFLRQLRSRHRIMFIAHDRMEVEFMDQFKSGDEVVFHSRDYHDYFQAYASCQVVLANRVHGAVCAAGFGRPAIIVGNDTRLQIGDYIGLPSRYVGNVSSEEIVHLVEESFSHCDNEQERLLALREESAARYKQEICDALAVDASSGTTPQRTGVWAANRRTLALASVPELSSQPYRDYMTTMNAFARRFGLREFTIWGKVWEYPWLWFNGMRDLNWSNLNLVDIGSEISPMPWYLASLGARVTLVECDDQWVPTWERMNELLGLKVNWCIVNDENLPFADNSCDVITSFSVIEHQPDKHKAVDEVARILKPGGHFFLSFDICEPEMGMTFPEWNGKALTLAEFEQTVLSHPQFTKQRNPVQWNVADMPEFVAWHVAGVAHHNYAAGASVLRKEVYVNQQIKKILIPRFDTFGDIVLLEGFIERLRTAFVSAEITMLVRQGYDQLAELFPTGSVNHWLSVDYNVYHEPTEAQEVAASIIFDQVVTESWDLVVFSAFNRTCLDNRLAASLPNILKYAIAEEQRIDGWPVENLVVVSVQEWSREADKYNQLAKAITGMEDDLQLPKLVVGTMLRDRAQDVLSGFGLVGQSYVVCVPAGTSNQTIKVWPAENFVEILGWLESRYGLSALLVGHQHEREQVMHLAGMLENKGITSKVWLGEDGDVPLMAALLQESFLYVGNDTGPMHIASAVGIPVVGIFGGGTFPRFLPIGKRAVGVAGELPCFGCYWNCFLADAPCMRVVTATDVKSAITMMLGEGDVSSNYYPLIDRGSERLFEFMQKCILFGREEGKAYFAAQETAQQLCQNSLVQTFESQLKAIKTSFTWRMTAPFRWIVDRFR